MVQESLETYSKHVKYQNRRGRKAARRQKQSTLVSVAPYCIFNIDSKKSRRKKQQTDDEKQWKKRRKNAMPAQQREEAEKRWKKQTKDETRHHTCDESTSND